ncbi:sodium/proton-translocating pyrophosphatase [Oligoflexia bacterium]|nr:sodium/proton-translocating pyrophosphatase [Oligoflexia bacterium]
MKREVQYLVFISAVMFLVLWVVFYFEVAFAFVLGIFGSLAVAAIGAAIIASVSERTAQAASEQRSEGALLTAFNGGAISGLSNLCVCLVGLGILKITFGESRNVQYLIGFGLGASVASFYIHFGSGIISKALTLGFDHFKGKHKDAPQDGLRRFTTLFDQSGRSINQICGAGADIFESYVLSITGALVVAAALSATDLASLTSFRGSLENNDFLHYRLWLMATPFFMGIAGVISSIIAVRSMVHLQDSEPASALKNSVLIGSIAFVAIMFFYILFVPLSMWLWIAMVVGVALNTGIAVVSEYITCSKPALRVAEASRLGSSAILASGVSAGFLNVLGLLVLMAVAIMIAGWSGGYFGIAIAAVAMLSVLSSVTSVKNYGSLTMGAGQLLETIDENEEGRFVVERMDSTGNAALAAGQGYIVCGAIFAALAVFGGLVQTLKTEGIVIDILALDFRLWAGIFIGVALPCALATCAIGFVYRIASKVEVELGQCLSVKAGCASAEGDQLALEVVKSIDFSTLSVLNKVTFIALVAIMVPILVGWVLGPQCLTGVVLGAMVVGAALSTLLTGCGGAWSSARRFIERGFVDGASKESKAHEAALVSDDLGGLLRVSIGSSLNILVKLIAIVAVLFAVTF